MISKGKVLLGSVIAGLGLAAPASAALVGASGPLSSLGAEAKILDAASLPTSVFIDSLFSDGIVGFNEKSGVVLPTDVETDAGLVPAGTKVDSHLFFMNGVDGKTGLVHGSMENPVQFTFDGLILGVLSNPFGNIISSTPHVGLDAVTYETSFDLMGFEAHDYLSFEGNVLSLALKTFVPGDWFRVVTLTPPPEPIPVPAAGLLLISGLGGLGLMRKRKQANS